MNLSKIHYHLSTLISKMGGTLGMLVGASIMDVLESHFLNDFGFFPNIHEEFRCCFKV